MKRKLILCAVAAVMAVCSVPAIWGQNTIVKGYVHDAQGQPIPGAILQLTNKANGRKFELKTNNKGEYYSLAVLGGQYDIVVFKDGKQLWMANNVNLPISETDNVINIDLKKEEAAREASLPPEVKKQMEEQAKEAAKIKSLNDRLAQSKVAMDAGNQQQAVTILTEASQIDARQPVIWAALAEAERAMAAKQTDPSEKKATYSKAVEHYTNAITLKPSAGYYNNMGDAAAHSGDTQAALQAYAAAAKLDPSNAAQYYFNEGAVLTNTGKVDEATVAFDKAIQADPTKPEAYYQKAMNLLNKATLKGNKMEAPPGTEEALKKYLQLQPTGEHAEVAKQMLASLGAEVETSFGKGKTPAKPKK
jgi:tetratricopeptide (TPR) repeat protein